MGCIFSKPSQAAVDQAGGIALSPKCQPTTTSPLNKQNASASLSPSGSATQSQSAKDKSTFTEASIPASEISAPSITNDFAYSVMHTTGPPTGPTACEPQAFATQTENFYSSSPPPSATPDQPSKNQPAPAQSSPTSPDVSPHSTGDNIVTTGPRASESQLSEPKTNKKASVLWEKAFSIMRGQEDKNCSPTDEEFPGGSLVENIIKEVTEKKTKCDDKRWFYNKGGQRVFIVDTLLVQLETYATIGDIAIQHNPDIVSLVWAGFRGLLQIGTAYVNQMRSVSDNLDYLVKLLCCCEIYEKLYCKTVLDIANDLNGSFINLYVSILKYLRKTSTYLDHSTGGRIIRSLSQETGNMLSEIEFNEAILNKNIEVAEKEASASNRVDQNNRMKHLRELLVEIQRPIEDTKRVVELIYTKVQNNRRLGILSWLSEVEYESHHLLSVQRRLPGTGTWLLKNGPFTRWVESEVNSILWLRADAGFGKTILASFIVDTFEPVSKSEDHVVAYFYCNYKEPERRCTESILRSLVKQFCVKKTEQIEVPTLVDNIYSEREARGRARGPLISEESTELIIELSEKYQSTTIIVDALDECDAQTRRTLFCSLHTIAEKAARFFSTGPYHYIDANDNAADINLYISSELERRCDVKNSHCEYQLLLDGKVSQELKDLIKSTLQSKSNGMFMWVNLQIEALCAAQRPHHVRQALTRIPETLNETYLQVMERIKLQNPDAYRVALDILRWLLHAQEACTTDSIIQALAVERGGATLDNADGCSWTVPMILGLCKNLVICDKTLGIFRFAHFSIQEFLVSQREFEPKSSNTYMAEICLTALLYHHADKPAAIPDLYKYAAKNWAAHVRLLDATSGLLEGLCTLFLKPSAPYKAWGYTIATDWSDLRISKEKQEVVPPLWVVCHYELYHFSKVLLSTSNEQLNFRNASGWTPLSWAVEKNHEQVVQLLVAKEGVDVNSRNASDWTPLLLAAESKRENLVQLLLEKADVDSKDGEHGRTPLSWAAGNGHEKVVQLLLAKEGMDINSKDNGGRIPLSWVAENGHMEVVQLLLAKEGVDVNSKDNEGRVPLPRAVEKGHEKIVHLLLEKEGVDMNSKDKGGRTPLSWAAENRCEKMLQLLLEKEGVDVNTRDNWGRTPLSWAAENGHEQMVQTLLEKEGVDVSPRDERGRIPLSFAAQNGDEKVVQLLLQKDGADVDSKDTYFGQSPLSWAAEKGYEKIVQLLLEKGGVDVNSRDEAGQTPLSRAAFQGHGKMVQLLLEQEGVDVNSSSIQGRTPLSWAAGKGHKKIVQLLLEQEGVDINSKDNGGRTPLSWAAEKGQEKVVELLLEKDGVVVDCKDNEGKNPLFWASKQGSKENESQHPLFWAPERGREVVVQLLQAKLAGVPSPSSPPPADVISANSSFLSSL